MTTTATAATRRTALQWLIGGTLGAGLAPMGLTAPALDFEDPADLLTAIAKMRASTDDRLVLGWLIGRRYAVVDTLATPMFGILAGTFSRYRQIDATTYEGRSFEVAYFTGLETGKLLETWQNPITGKTIEVQHVRMGPSRFLLRAPGLVFTRPTGSAVGMERYHRFLPAVVHREDVWISEDIRVSGTPPGPDAKPFAYNEMTTYQAKRTDLENDGLATVPTHVFFHNLVSYRPWMGFGAAPGHTTARGSGTRIARVEDFPRQYLELTERYHPDALEDPLGILDGEAD